MNNPLKPNTTLLASLGSIIVHFQEMLSSDGHEFDKRAVEGLLADPRVVEWLEQMDQMVLLPRLRSRDGLPESKGKSTEEPRSLGHAMAKLEKAERKPKRKK